MQNEAVRALFKNYSEENGMDIRFLGTGNGARYFADFVQNGDYYADDAPDMMLKKGNEAIIIEHFEFDSYHADRKGSPGRREMARIQRNEDSIEATADGVFFSDEIKGKSSFHDLLTNLCRSFTEHYSRIPKYKENLKRYGLIDDSTQVKVMFLVEDVSPLGSIVIDGKKQRPIIMLLCKEFLDLFKEATGLDYILSCSSAAENNFVWFADRREIEEYYKCAVDYENKYFLDFDVQVVGFKMAFPREETRDK